MRSERVRQDARRHSSSLATSREVGVEKFLDPPTSLEGEKKKERRIRHTSSLLSLTPFPHQTNVRTN